MKNALIFALLLVSSVVQAKTVTDILQRKVQIPDNPQRIVLGEGRLIYTLALVEQGNPVRRMVGWPGDLPRYDRQTWDRYTTAFPEIKKIPFIGTTNYAQVSAEKVIALHPDLVILSVYAKQASNHDSLQQQLTDAGIPVVYVDTRVDQLKNTVPSLEILGEVFNQQAKAQRFIAFYQQHMNLIRDRLQQAKPERPRVMLQLHIGRREVCCTTVGHGNMADLLAFAGGNNIAAERFSSVFGQISPEAVIAADPNVYIVTGMAGPTQAGQLQLGPQVNPKQAQQSFVQALQQENVLSTLPAIRHGKALAVWHNFYISPWHLLDVEMFAKVFHPRLFSDLDPAKTLEQMNREFLPVPETGTYWTQLDNSQ
ncbi:ABC transporter substrate-binding protein [Erwinia tracheiphila]|uniref:Periplasmic binding protein n=1 Tax=Erwinia tracheiphila TaxID=65700 RepID=A0A0M2KIA3_9GAMM|nr:ABC transporter substrate-binding protein [Erwinia tracheiphila]EOS94782.1 Fe3+-hydroxamate ABC transporter substrate-binding protein [Erwinia tracheiphila PSU-1]KKF37042.1 periplasmic binding protein [Erwinia tracheiphila]UIA88396.1 ABC transporter substrate-binding protein [Erwinia tracheiphila]UIA96182.1 ABC transporter substrate-binding protein [Erwinia tracheiphila]